MRCTNGPDPHVVGPKRAVAWLSRFPDRTRPRWPHVSKVVWRTWRCQRTASSTSGARPGCAQHHARQTSSIEMFRACAASAATSASSAVKTVPFGSAIATTSASTADPLFARRRSSAARRATSILTTSSFMTVLRNRFAFASLPECPCKDSTSTIVGTTGGQSPAFLNSWISASERRDRWPSRLKPPLSSTSMCLTGFRQMTVLNSLHNTLRPRSIAARRLTNFTSEIFKVPICCVEGVLSLDLGTNSNLQQF